MMMSGEAAAAMEVNAEARRILAVSISKLYASRSQRGGLRLHRSLLLSMVMRSARDIYHSSRESEAQTAAEEEEPEEEPAVVPVVVPAAEEEAMDTGAEAAPEPVTAEEEVEEPEEPDAAEDKENQSPARQSRKRRGKASAAPDFLPSKRARLEPGEERHGAAPPPQPPPGCCRTGPLDSLSALSLNRVIPAC